MGYFKKAFSLAETMVVFIVMTGIILLAGRFVFANNQEQYKAKYTKVATEITANLENNRLMQSGLKDELEDYKENFIQTVTSNLNGDMCSYNAEAVALDGGSYDSGCWSNKISRLNSEITNAMKDGDYNFYKLNDETVLAIQTDNYAEGTKLPKIYIDVNGTKGPNVFEKDVFEYRYGFKDTSYAERFVINCSYPKELDSDTNTCICKSFTLNGSNFSIEDINSSLYSVDYGTCTVIDTCTDSDHEIADNKCLCRNRNDAAFKGKTFGLGGHYEHNGSTCTWHWICDLSEKSGYVTNTSDKKCTQNIDCSLPYWTATRQTIVAGEVNWGSATLNSAGDACIWNPVCASPKTVKEVKGNEITCKCPVDSTKDTTIFEQNNTTCLYECKNRNDHSDFNVVKFNSNKCEWSCVNPNKVITGTNTCECPADKQQIAAENGLALDANCNYYCENTAKELVGTSCLCKNRNNHKEADSDYDDWDLDDNTCAWSCVDTNKTKVTVNGKEQCLCKNRNEEGKVNNKKWELDKESCDWDCSPNSEFAATPDDYVADTAYRNITRNNKDAVAKTTTANDKIVINKGACDYTYTYQCQSDMHGTRKIEKVNNKYQCLCTNRSEKTNNKNPWEHDDYLCEWNCANNCGLIDEDTISATGPDKNKNCGCTYSCLNKVHVQKQKSDGTRYCDCADSILAQHANDDIWTLNRQTCTWAMSGCGLTCSTSKTNGVEWVLDKANCSCKAQCLSTDTYRNQKQVVNDNGTYKCLCKNRSEAGKVNDKKWVHNATTCVWDCGTNSAYASSPVAFDSATSQRTVTRNDKNAKASKTTTNSKIIDNKGACDYTYTYECKSTNQGSRKLENISNKYQCLCTNRNTNPWNPTAAKHNTTTCVWSCNNTNPNKTDSTVTWTRNESTCKWSGVCASSVANKNLKEVVNDNGTYKCLCKNRALHKNGDADWGDWNFNTSTCVWSCKDSKKEKVTTNGKEQCLCKNRTTYTDNNNPYALNKTNCTWSCATKYKCSTFDSGTVTETAAALTNTCTCSYVCKNNKAQLSTDSSGKKVCVCPSNSCPPFDANTVKKSNTSDPTVARSCQCPLVCKNSAHTMKTGKVSPYAKYCECSDAILNQHKGDNKWVLDKTTCKWGCNPDYKHCVHYVKAEYKNGKWTTVASSTESNLVWTRNKTTCDWDSSCPTGMSMTPDKKACACKSVPTQPKDANIIIAYSYGKKCKANTEKNGTQPWKFDSNKCQWTLTCPRVYYWGHGKKRTGAGYYNTMPDSFGNCCSECYEMHKTKGSGCPDKSSDNGFSCYSANGRIYCDYYDSKGNLKGYQCITTIVNSKGKVVEVQHSDSAVHSGQANESTAQTNADKKPGHAYCYDK